MPFFTLQSGLTFSYTDSGIPHSDQTDYVTLFLIHGIMFHNGTFASLAAIGPSNGVRVIAVNRRGYPGTTPYSAEELTLFVSGNGDDKERLLAEMGQHLALLIAGLITSLSLPAHVEVAGWSLGALKVLSIAASIDMLPEDARQTLTSSVRSMILLQGPSIVYAVPDPEGFYVPQSDPAISPAELGPFFARWVSSFFVHGDLSKHELSSLTYDRTDPDRSPSIVRLPMDHLVDFEAASKYDDIVVSPSFSAATAKQLDKALFDVHIRGNLWKNTKFFCVVTSADSWNTMYGAWKLEERMRAEAKPECEITFKLVKGANHFFVMEDAQGAMDCFKTCFV